MPPSPVRTLGWDCHHRDRGKTHTAHGIVPTLIHMGGSAVRNESHLTRVEQLNHTRARVSTGFARRSFKGAPMLIGSVVSLAVLATAALVFFTISKLIGGLGNKGS